jgi:hypothetical protein
MYTCFTTYFKPIHLYIKKVNILVSANDFDLYFKTVSLATIHQCLSTFYEREYFGVSNFILLIVIGTVLIDAVFGVQRSIKKSHTYYRKAKRLESDDPNRARFIRLYRGYQFNSKKLLFTFFKCLTLIFYLFCANHIMEYQKDDSSIAVLMGFASGVVVKAPIAFFWYYDFKSIGRNIEYVYGKKPPIFPIVESMFEPRLAAFLKKEKDDGFDEEVEEKEQEPIK